MKDITIHENYYNSDGIQIPSVTEVIKLLNKPELVEWANWLGLNHKSSTLFTKNAALNGTLVHYIIEKDIKKKILDVNIIDNLSIDNYMKVHNAYNSFKRWKKDYEPKFINSEMKLKNDEVGGTVDCICKVNKEKVMVDFKTSKKAYPSYFIQLAGYNYLLRTTKDIKLDCVAILVLDKNKYRYDYIQMDIDYLEERYERIFLLLLELYYRWNSILNKDWNNK